MLVRRDGVFAGSRKGILRTLGFFFASAVPRVVQFGLTFTGLVVGAITTPIWIGIPIVEGTLRMTGWFCRIERQWVGRMLDVEVPPVAPIEFDPDEDRGLIRRVFRRITDSRTWREVAYVALAMPLGLAELAVAAIGVVLVPVSIWAVPWIGFAHGLVARGVLGPTKKSELQRRAERLQASRARGVDAAEAERRRIERDLHDGAQQRLVSVAMSLGQAKMRLAQDPESAREFIEEAHVGAKLAVSELRDLARGISPAVLRDRGLDAALSALAAKSPMDVRIDTKLNPRPPAAVETTAYFIVAESLTNAAKYAEATEVTVRARRDGDGVTVEVTDNGVGGAKIRPGGGLAGLADRAATIDGVITVESPVGGPTVIRAELPCSW
ncbi:sensor histidine kinase [Saccharothrix luteola]|uniref:sensor histidine kinase n=1 Tax=Saccharothrix luteola TaxID=2893018 RepID=UPI001E597BED|nr:sensor histidine kinase [Saccharothrix luteola]MCC8245589.1 sensor domain-containing protein [Saccharothrix luteola]